MPPSSVTRSSEPICATLPRSSVRTGTTTTYGIGISRRMRLISSDGSHPGGLPIPRMKSSGVMSSNSPRWRLASKSPSSGTSSFITGMVPLSRTACECRVLPILPIAQSGAAVCLRGVRLYTFRKRAFAILRSIARYCFLESAYSVSREMGNAYGNACSHFAGFQPGRRIQ